MASHLSLGLSFFFFFLNLPSNLALAKPKLILEEGYTVTTVINGHEHSINPHSLLSRSRSSDLILLDSSRSTFYTLSLPISQESVINRLSGDGTAGSSDGEPGSAQFNKPKSFTVDNKGNIYVADRLNGAIRKITTSGVSTIAGGYSKGSVGHEDGPAQNATFSNDFDVAFVAQECALLISDHGNQLIRRLPLKPEDCISGGGDQSALGAVSFWVLGVGLLVSCLFGFVIGFVMRPLIKPPHGGFSLHFSKTWRLYLINLANPVLIFCFGFRSEIPRFRHFAFLKRLLQMSLSQLALMFRLNTTVGPQDSRKNMDSQVVSKQSVSLLDSDVNSFELETSQLCAELKDLISFNDPFRSSNLKNEISEIGQQDQLGSDVLLGGCRRIDAMIEANITGFAKVAEETTPFNGSLLENQGLVRRR